MLQPPCVTEAAVLEVCLVFSLVVVLVVNNLCMQSSEETIDKLFIHTPDELAQWGSISVVLMIASASDGYNLLPRNPTAVSKLFAFFLTVTMLHLEG